MNPIATYLALEAMASAVRNRPVSKPVIKVTEKAPCRLVEAIRRRLA